MNNGCASCDYRPGCHKKLVAGGKKVLAKEQDELNMACVNIVQDICRDCRWFINKKCASWLILNGERVAGRLAVCPKKIKGE